MDSNLQNPISKIQKVVEESDSVDRISSLPNDELIYRILSLLPTKYAVCCGILSTRWKNIWVSLPILDFDYQGSYEDDHLKKFMDFVDKLLGIRLNVRTEKFRFSCPNGINYPKLYSWLKIIMVYNLEELDLEVGYIQKLPSTIFRYKTLVVLKLCGKFTLDVPSEVSLPNLKLLSLKGVEYVNDASFRNLLCGCHVLEDLEIERNGYYDYSWTYAISVFSLKRLILNFSGILLDFLYNSDNESGDDGDDNLKPPTQTLSLHTPNLERLTFVGQIPKLTSVTDMRFLCEADIRIIQDWKKDEEYEIGLCALLEAIPNVTHLSLSGDAQRNLEDLFDDEIVFQKLIHLELGFDKLSGPVLLPYFLMVSPNLQSISLPEGISNPVEQYFDPKKGIYFEYEWIPPNNVPECLLASLKKVEVREHCGGEAEALNLIKYLLKNAMVLEKMTVSFHQFPFRVYGVNCCSCKKNKLMNYPRGSPSVDLCIYVPPRKLKTTFYPPLAFTPDY